jgi:hypothetical protein
MPIVPEGHAVHLVSLARDAWMDVMPYGPFVLEFGAQGSDPLDLLDRAELHLCSLPLDQPAFYLIQPGAADHWVASGLLDEVFGRLARLPRTNAAIAVVREGRDATQEVLSRMEAIGMTLFAPGPTCCAFAAVQYPDGSVMLGMTGSAWHRVGSPARWYPNRQPALDLRPGPSNEKGMHSPAADWLSLAVQEGADWPSPENEALLLEGLARMDCLVAVPTGVDLEPGRQHQLPGGAGLMTVTCDGLWLLLALPDFAAAQRHPHLIGRQPGAVPLEELVHLVLDSDLDGIYLDVASGDDARAVLTREFIEQLVLPGPRRS